MNQSQQRRPIEADYIPQARRVVTAMRLKEAAETELEAARRSTALAMQNAPMTRFEFVADDKQFVAKLGRKKVRRVSIQKLYTLLANHEISITDFLDCVVPDAQKVRDLLDDRFPSVLEVHRDPIDLIIREKQEDEE